MTDQHVNQTIYPRNVIGVRSPATIQPRFSGVLLDWRGTLVVAPTYTWLITRALRDLGRPHDSGAVDEVRQRLAAVDTTEVESSAVDVDAGLHRQAYSAWFRAAGLDLELSDALYAAESDVAANPFAEDVGALLAEMHDAGVRIGVLSDIHVDLRPAFTAQRVQTASGEQSWVDLVDVWVLSFEVGAAKPDPVIFQEALALLALPACEVLMVGDRATHDGAAVDLGMTTLLVPPLTSPSERRLHRVLDLVLPGHDLEI